MKRIVIFVFFTFIVLNINNVLATETRLSLGVQMNHFFYEEPDSMEDSGWLKGILANVDHFKNGYYYNGSISFITGDTKYDGETMEGKPLTLDNSNDIFEIRGKVGKAMQHGIVLYGGLGRYRLYNKTKYEYSYRRWITSYYLPLGIEFGVRNKDGITGGFEYDLVITGTVRSNFSDIDPGFNDIIHDRGPGDGRGMRGKIGVKINEWILGMEILYWKFKDSDIVELKYHNSSTGIWVYEPENKTVIFSFQGSYTFRWKY